MKRIYLGIIVLCLGILSISVYYLFGGFEPIEVYEFEGTTRTVIGKHHIGRLTPGKVKDLLMESKSLIDSGKLKGMLTLVEYQNDTIGNDSTHLFIGASFDEIRNVLETPSGFTYEEYETDKIYRVFITQLIQPLPSDVIEAIETRSTEQGITLQPYIFDVYYSDGSLCTEAWADTPQ